MKRALVLLSCVIATACGSSSPVSPSNPSSSAPTNFLIASQSVTMTANIVVLTWSGTAAAYKVFAGSAAGGSDLLNVDVTGTSYTWTAPRTANIIYVRVAGVSGGTTSTAAQELPVFTIDMRNMIDALFFGYGPMSDANGAAPASSAAVWADGAAINTLVTEESGSASLTAVQGFVAEYLAATSNFVSVSVGTTPTRYAGVSLFAIPLNTVIVRVDQSICNQPGVLACAYYGPLPYGPGRSFVNLNAPATGSTPDAYRALSHEIGHSFGLHHLRQSSGNRPEFAFLLNPIIVAERLTTAEKTALAAARAGGIRPGWTRAQALAAGLVLPQTGATFSWGMPRFPDDITVPPLGIR